MQRHPAWSYIGTALLMAALVIVMRHVFTPEGALPAVSAAAFTAAACLFILPVVNGLAAEGLLRPDPPFWRLRYGMMQGYWFAVFMCLYNGFALPSASALTFMLVAGGIYGAFMGFNIPRNLAGIEQQFDIDRPLYASRWGDRALRVWPFVLWAFALFLAAFPIVDTVYAYVWLIALAPAVTPFNLRNQTKWRERDVLIVLSGACVLTGLLTA